MNKSRMDYVKAKAILFPSIILLAIFVYGFIGWSIRTSFSKWDGIIPNYDFAGLENYLYVFSTPRFQQDLLNTLFFTIFFLLLCIGMGLFIANLLDKRLKGTNIFQTLFLFPFAISFVVTGVVWRWIFNPTVGINALLQKIGINVTWGWYTDPTQIGGFHVALVAVFIAAAWQFTGYTMAMFLAGMRGISEDIYEAAHIDGANDRQIFWKIKVPLLRPIILSALIVLGHISLKIFDLVYTMTGPGPAFATDMPGIYMFETTFRGNHYAEGAVISVVMLAMVAVVIVPYLYSSFRKER